MLCSTVGWGPGEGLEVMGARVHSDHAEARVPAHVVPPACGCAALGGGALEALISGPAFLRTPGSPCL